MFEKLLALLPQHPGATADTVGTPFEQRQLAVTVLLLELAQADRSVPPEELAAIGALVRERFGLDADTAARLLDAAQTILGAALEDWVFATTIRNTFDAGERLAIVSLLWEVVYADGRLAKLEQEMIAHLARELGIDAAESAAARAQALARIELRHAASDRESKACDR